MTPEDTRSQYLRAEITALMKRAPERLGGASVQVVREYKKWYLAAAKTLESRRAQLRDIEALHNQAKGYYP